MPKETNNKAPQVEVVEEKTLSNKKWVVVVVVLVLALLGLGGGLIWQVGENRGLEEEVEWLGAKLIESEGTIVQVLGIDNSTVEENTPQENSDTSQEDKTIDISFFKNSGSKVLGKVSYFRGNCSFENAVVFSEKRSDVFARINDDCSGYDLVYLRPGEGRNRDALVIDEDLQLGMGFSYSGIMPAPNFISPTVFTTGYAIGDAGLSLGVTNYFQYAPYFDTFYKKLIVTRQNEKLSYRYAKNPETEYFIYNLDLLFEDGVGCEARSAGTTKFIGMTVSTTEYRKDFDILSSENEVTLHPPDYADTTCYDDNVWISSRGQNDSLQKAYFSVGERNRSNTSEIVWEEFFEINLETGEVTQEEPTDLLEIIEPVE